MPRPSTRSVTAAAVAVLALHAAGASAWGPASHATFNCLGMYGETPVAQCLETQATQTVASDLPDSFAFGSFNVAGEAAGPADWGCTGLSHVHDPLFGAHLLRFASARNATYSSPAFDAVAFARGFMGHMLGDLVGFNPKGGILASREAGTPTASGYLYFPGLSYMAALDAFYLRNAGMPGARMPLPGPATTGANGEAAVLLNAAMVDYNRGTPSFGVVSAATVEQCISFWGKNMAYVFDRAQFYESTGANGDFLERELAWFAPRDEHGNAPTTDQVTEWAMRQRNCSAEAVGFYYSQISGSSIDAATAFKNVAAMVEKLYDVGSCTYST